MSTGASELIPESANLPNYLSIYLEFYTAPKGQQVVGHPQIVSLGNQFSSARQIRRTFYNVCSMTSTPNPFKLPIIITKMGSLRDVYEAEGAGRYNVDSYLPKVYQTIQMMPWPPVKKQMAWTMRLVSIYFGARAGSQLGEYCYHAQDFYLPGPRVEGAWDDDGHPRYGILGMRMWKGRPAKHGTNYDKIVWLRIIRNPNREYAAYCVLTNVLMWLTVSGITRGPIFRRIVRGLPVLESHVEMVMFKVNGKPRPISLWVEAPAAMAEDGEDEDEGGCVAAGGGEAGGGEADVEEEDEEEGGGEGDSDAEDDLERAAAAALAAAEEAARSTAKPVNMSSDAVRHMTKVVNNQAGIMGPGGRPVRPHADRSAHFIWATTLGASLGMIISVTMHKLMCKSWADYFGEGEDIEFTTNPRKIADLIDIFPYPAGGIRVNVQSIDWAEWLCFSTTPVAAAGAAGPSRARQPRAAADDGP